MPRLKPEEVERIVALMLQKHPEFHCEIDDFYNIRCCLQKHKKQQTTGRVQIIYSTAPFCMTDVSGAPLYQAYHWSAMDILFDKGDAKSIFFADSAFIGLVEPVIETVCSVFPNVKNLYYTQGFQVDDSCSVFATTFCFDLAKIPDLHDLLNNIKGSVDMIAGRKIFHVHKSRFEGALIGLLKFVQSTRKLNYLCATKKLGQEKIKGEKTLSDYVHSHNKSAFNPKLNESFFGRILLGVRYGFEVNNYAIFFKYNKYKNQLREENQSSDIVFGSIN